MDKAQKELLDTYIRKRKIANATEDDMGSRFEYQIYELSYFMEKKLLSANDVIGRINLKQVVDIFTKKPELADDEDVQKLFYIIGRPRMKSDEYVPPSVTILIDVIKRQPKFVRTKFFNKAYNEIMHRFETDLIASMLIAQPSLAYEPNFAPFIKTIGESGHDDDLVSVLIKRPELADKFNLKKLRTQYAIELVFAQPQFIDDLNLNGRVTDFDVEMARKFKPQLVKKLEGFRKNG